MSETHVGDLPPGTKRCVACAEPINAAATKCIHCSTDQDRRRYLSLSSTALSLLVALVSVLTAAVPVAIIALTPKNSHLVFSAQGVTPGKIALLVSNQGIRPGSIQPDALLYWGVRGKDSFSLNLYVNTSSPAILIDPSKSRPLLLVAGESPRWPLPTDEGKCGIVVFHTDFLGRPSFNQMKLPYCSLIRNFMAGAEISTPSPR